ncbi:hypothetical protein [Porphyromonas crevioricanis]|nr:hypothetical protein [Porphyromonas crevioricanis]GAD07342.1 hypothetical protein PORCAN_962 [Porphyromonas crevioricanis JCM 13913]
MIPENFWLSVSFSLCSDKPMYPPEKNWIVKLWLCWKYAGAILLIWTIILPLIATFSCGLSKRAELPQFASHTPIYREWPRLSVQELDSLREIYGRNKLFLEEYIEPTLIALSYYPELRDVPIEFKYSSEATTMAARPISGFLLGKRKYGVLINGDKNFEGVLLQDTPFNAQIGIIGHELAHIADYNRKNIWGILGCLFRYLDQDRRPLFEKETDMATIERGLGWQLYDWAVYAMYHSPKATERYKEFKQYTYMKPEEISYLIRHFSGYASVKDSISTFSEAIGRQ